MRLLRDYWHFLKGNSHRLHFNHRTSQAGDIPDFSHLSTAAPIRSGFNFQSARIVGLVVTSPFCSVPEIPPASSRAGLSVSASLLSTATVTGFIVSPSAIGTGTQKATFYCVLMLQHQFPWGVTHEKVASYRLVLQHLTRKLYIKFSQSMPRLLKQ